LNVAAAGVVSHYLLTLSSQLALEIDIGVPEGCASWYCVLLQEVPVSVGLNTFSSCIVHRAHQCRSYKELL